MVYRLGEDETRHADWPLRLGPDGTDAVVESHRIACSHFDAFRFFTEPAAPAQHALAHQRGPRRLRAAGLPARRDGPLQARLPADPDDLLGPGRRLLRAGPRHPRARHARGAVRPRGPRLRAGPDRDRRRQAGVRRGAARLRRARRPAAGPAGRRVRAAARAVWRPRSSLSPCAVPVLVCSPLATGRDPASALAARRTTAGADPRWVFYSTDTTRYASPWYAGDAPDHDPLRLHPAPYYSPDRRCRDAARLPPRHRRRDARAAPGSSAGRRAGWSSTPRSGPAYGTNPLLLRNRRQGWDLVIGHTRRVFVHPGDRVRPGTLIARASDNGAPDGCHLHFEQRAVGGLARSASDSRGAPVTPGAWTRDRGARTSSPRRPAAHDPRSGKLRRARPPRQPSSRAATRAEVNASRPHPDHAACAATCGAVPDAARTASRHGEAAMRASGRFRDEDWYGEDLGAVRFVDCTFTNLDLSEVTTAGAHFESCTFHGGRFNASTHRSSAFVACDFRRVSFFDATFEGCKLLGSSFAECTLRPIRVLGGQWRGVTIRGTDLSGLDLSGLDLREADLSLSSLARTVLRGRAARGRHPARDRPRRRRPARRRARAGRPRRRPAGPHPARPGRRGRPRRAARRRGRRRPPERWRRRLSAGRRRAGGSRPPPGRGPRRSRRARGARRRSRRRCRPAGGSARRWRGRRRSAAACGSRSTASSVVEPGVGERGAQVVVRRAGAEAEGVHGRDHLGAVAVGQQRVAQRAAAGRPPARPRSPRSAGGRGAVRAPGSRRRPPRAAAACSAKWW